MKKALMLFGLLFALGISQPQAAQGVKADEPPISETLPTSETSETIEDDVVTADDLPEWVKTIFSPALITTIINVIGVLGVVIKLANDLKKSKSLLSLSNKEVVSEVKSAIVPLIDRILEEKMASIDQKSVENYQEVKVLVNKMMQVFALSQENTPESRVAILQILAGFVDPSLLKKANAAIEIQEKEKVEKKNELNAIVEAVLGEPILDEDGKIDSL